MKFDILTLFPEMFEPLKQSVIGKATQKKLIEINIINFREFSKLNNNQVDDTPFGGGPGMVLMLEPIVDCLESIKTLDSKIILMSPQGKTYNQKKAYELKNEKHLIIICGHYEGFDERISNFIDEEISIGDYILTGGEIPAMAISDSIIRLIDGVIKKESFLEESFKDNLLDYPVYTKPRNFRDLKVPDVLLSGNHQKIEEWRKKAQIKNTKEKRNDLLS